MPKSNAVFAIDGFEISATFAESQNTVAIGQVKQILLSSFVAQTTSTRPGVILVKPSEQRDNNGVIMVGVVPMHLDKFKNPAYEKPLFTCLNDI